MTFQTYCGQAMLMYAVALFVATTLGSGRA